MSGIPDKDAALAQLGQKVYPIDLATALRLAQAKPIDVMVAAKQLELASVQYDRSKLLIIPNLSIGFDHLRHEGAFQNFQGTIIQESRSTSMIGAGLNLTFGISDAIYVPLVAKQELLARQSITQAVGNDVALSVTEIYFQVLQAKAEYQFAQKVVVEAEEIARKTADLAEGLAPSLEAKRTKVDLSRRKQAVIIARERWRTTSAELTRLLRLDPSVVVDPSESPAMTIALFPPEISLDDLITTALLNRPELAANQAFVQATLQRLKQEKLRPLVPSVLIRSVSTNPSGSLGAGFFGGGKGSRTGDFNGRLDYDVQILWELQNLGFGNKARVAERRVEHETALLELFRTQDRIAAEVATAYTQTTAAWERLQEAEPALRDATDLLEKNKEGLTQTRRNGNILVLVIRPLEVIAAVQAYFQANLDYYSAVSDFNRSQFRLWRAIGKLPSIAETTERPVTTTPFASDRKPDPEKK